ncbi:MAG: hypothetical protein IBX68_11155 [Dehalococcoidia bacterium]|nr:hypothetical protein [Dehalococcoidia bacterium]
MEDFIWLGLYLGFYLFSVFCWWRMLRKAGYGHWGISALVPVAALILLIVMAFADWPVLRHRRQMSYSSQAAERVP